MRGGEPAAREGDGRHQQRDESQHEQEREPETPEQRATDGGEKERRHEGGFGYQDAGRRRRSRYAPPSGRMMAKSHGDVAVLLRRARLALRERVAETEGDHAARLRGLDHVGAHALAGGFIGRGLILYGMPSNGCL